MSVGVIIPYGGRCPYRWRAMLCVFHSYLARFDGRVYAAGDPLASEFFSRARAINHGVAVMTRRFMPDILVINDADSLVPQPQIHAAIGLAMKAPGMVRAYTRYRRLSQAYTERLPTDPTIAWRAALLAPDHAFHWEQEPAYAHGCVAIRRECFEETGGYDEKFEGWGYEDMAFEALCHCFWPDRRVPGDLIHLWHPVVSDGPDARRNEERYYRLYEPYRPHSRAELMEARNLD